jgi:hypothetical protein
MLFNCLWFSAIFFLYLVFGLIRLVLIWVHIKDKVQGKSLKVLDTLFGGNFITLLVDMLDKLVPAYAGPIYIWPLNKIITYTPESLVLFRILTLLQNLSKVVVS